MGKYTRRRRNTMFNMISVLFLYAASLSSHTISAYRRTNSFEYRKYKRSLSSYSRSSGTSKQHFNRVSFVLSSSQGLRRRKNVTFKNKNEFMDKFPPRGGQTRSDTNSITGTYTDTSSTSSELSTSSTSSIISAGTNYDNFDPNNNQTTEEKEIVLAVPPPSPKPPTPSIETTSTNTELISNSNEISNNESSLWSIRILFLTYYASLGSLLPYLPVYYHSLGHHGSHIGILGAVNPFTTFIVAPLWGMLADRTNRHKDILKLTFVTSLVLRLCISLKNNVSWLITTVFLTALMNAPVKSLLDSSVMNQLNNAGQGSSYGKLRLWGQVGFGLGSSGIGFLLHRSALGYKVAFIMHALVSLPAMICIYSFKHTTLNEETVTAKDDDAMAVETDSKPENKIRDGLYSLLHNMDALVFFFLVLIIGISSGVIENFAYVRMREVGGTGREMGISRFISSASGAPMFWFSEKLTSGRNSSTILVMSLVCYAVRFFIYASMKHPLGGLPAEALRGATFAAFWSTATVYAHKISPPGLSATTLILLNAMYGGLGQSLGAIIGGKMQSAIGTTQTFWYVGAADGVFVCFFLLYKKLSQIRANARERRKKVDTNGASQNLPADQSKLS